MDLVATQRYASVRKQLDQLHYPQPFSKSVCDCIAIESASLVERLLEDLLRTTEAYQQLKSDLNAQVHEKNLN
jgi:hypothetical protein